jgi:hypothetical protein
VPCNAGAAQCEPKPNYTAAVTRAVRSDGDRDSEGKDVSSLGEWRSDMASGTAKCDVGDESPSGAEMGVGT